MGNTYTTPPTIPDTGDLIAGRIIKEESLRRMGDLSNYLHATGATTNCISQSFDEFICDESTSNPPILPAVAVTVPCIVVFPAASTNNPDEEISILPPEALM